MERDGVCSGDVIGGYVVERRLGRGGMATVYAVRDERTGAAYALKLLDLPSPVLRARMEREASVQAAFRHPNVVAVHALVSHGGCPGIVMELVDGPDLARGLAEGALAREHVETVAVGIIEGTAAAHRAGLVHRDLKPANVLLAGGPGGPVPKIADFGLAKLLDGAPSAVETRTGHLMGTPQYMAPEQFRDAKRADLRSDVWSLGCILYELVTGRRPFDGEDPFELYRSMERGAFTAPEALAPDAEPRWIRAIAGCLRADPARRIPDCEALIAVWRGELDGWAAGEGAGRHATPDTLADLGAFDGGAAPGALAPKTPTPSGPWARRPGGVAALLLMVVALGSIAVPAWWSGGARVGAPPPADPSATPPRAPDDPSSPVRPDARRPAAPLPEEGTPVGAQGVAEAPLAPVEVTPEVRHVVCRLEGGDDLENASLEVRTTSGGLQRFLAEVESGAVILSVPAERGEGLLLAEGYLPARLAWDEAAPDRPGICVPDPLPIAAAEAWIVGRVVGAEGREDVGLIGCGQRRPLDADGGFAFRGSPGERCVVTVVHERDGRTVAGDSVHVKIEANRTIELTLQGAVP